MDVAFVSDVVYPEVKGGAEKRIHEIGRRLGGRGHEVTVYGRHFWDGPATISRDGMTLRGVAPERDLYVGDRRSITEALGFAAKVVAPLYRNRDRHDVVVASVFPYFPVLAAKGALLGETPLVVTWHEVWLDYWNEYLGALAPFGTAVERLTAAVPHEPIAVSGATADRLARIGPDRERISVVPNGVDVERVAAVDPAEDGYDVLFVGRLIADKNVDLLLAAFDRVLEDGKYSLGIIGTGPERAALERECARRDCTDRVDFLGVLEDDEAVLSHLRAADVFVSLSTREGFGIACLEALAASCPVICVDHPASAASEVVDGAGFAIDPTVDAAAETLEAVLGGKTPPESPASVAREYDWDRVADRAETKYRVVVERA